MINDIRRAYVYAPATRSRFTRLPQEGEDAQEGEVGRLHTFLYGTRDAARGWQQTLTAHLESIGFVKGRGHPSVFHHPSCRIRTLAHGDDNLSCGRRSESYWPESQLNKAYKAKTQRLRKPAGHELRCYHAVRITSMGFEIEAEQRHAELSNEQMSHNDKQKPRFVDAFLPGKQALTDVFGIGRFCTKQIEAKVGLCVSVRLVRHQGCQRRCKILDKT